MTEGQIRLNCGSKYFCGPYDNRAIKAARIDEKRPTTDVVGPKIIAAIATDKEAPRNGAIANSGIVAGG